MVIDHRAAMTDTGVRCSCGSDSCIVTIDGVWTPSRRTTAAEWAEAFATFTADSVGDWVRRAVRDHAGHGGAMVAEHEADESLFWRFTPAGVES
jgi:hypothetical protein